MNKNRSRAHSIFNLLSLNVAILCGNFFSLQLDVVKQNYVTKTENEKLYFADVTQAAFNDDGSWLATVSNAE